MGYAVIEDTPRCVAIGNTDGEVVAILDRLKHPEAIAGIQFFLEECGGDGQTPQVLHVATIGRPILNAGIPLTMIGRDYGDRPTSWSWEPFGAEEETIAIEPWVMLIEVGPSMPRWNYIHTLFAGYGHESRTWVVSGSDYRCEFDWGIY